MSKKELKGKILQKLKKIYPKKSEGAIRTKLSKLSRKYNVTLNAAADLMAREVKRSVYGLLDNDDKKSLDNKTVQIIPIKQSPNKTNKKNIIPFISYKTSNSFLSSHIQEINKCYTFSCYTAAYILIRKVIENLIMELIKKKFPKREKADLALYLDLSRGRIHDLSILIKNLRSKSSSFLPDEKKLIRRILQLAEQFKGDANDKTHSLYHLSSKKELEEKKPQQIFDLIKEHFDKY